MSMKSKLILAIVLLLSLAVAGMAQGQKVATASSTGPFALRGGVVNPEGVPSWPVMAGDEVAAQGVPVTLTFEDGSRIVLAPGSRGRIEQGAQGRPVFRLMAGEAWYDLRELSSVDLYALNRRVSAPAFRGNYSLGGAQRAATTFWTARNVALALGAAGGVAATTVWIANSTPEPLSPSRR
jgi:hypothetical protein